MPTTNYDIVIFGAGIVGLTCAGLLANSNLKIAVVDKQFPKIGTEKKSTFDLRVSAITVGSQKIFEKIGVWEKLSFQQFSAFDKMQVWDAHGNSHIDFASEALGEQQLGFIVGNNILQTALYERLNQLGNIVFIQSDQLNDLQEINDQISLQLNNEQVTTKLLIGADGANSKIRELAQIANTHWDYGQSALVTNVRTSQSHQQTARQVFLADGPLAFLPLADSYWCSIVWSTNPSSAEHLMKMDEDEFKQKLQTAIHSRLGNIEEISTRAIFPLRMQHAKQYIKSGIALIGDAAHTIHPLAGQGVNLGLHDADSLANLILSAQQKNKNIASITLLRRYERERKSENCAMISFIEAIKQIFSQEKSVLRDLANVGLSITNHLPPLKYFFMRRAMGV